MTPPQHTLCQFVTQTITLCRQANKKACPRTPFKCALLLAISLGDPGNKAMLLSKRFAWSYISYLILSICRCIVPHAEYRQTVLYSWSFMAACDGSVCSAWRKIWQVTKLWVSRWDASNWWKWLREMYHVPTEESITPLLVTHLLLSCIPCKSLLAP